MPPLPTLSKGRGTMHPCSGVPVCATAELQKTLCAGVVAGTRFITPKKTTTLSKPLA